ncbi:MAG TPA: amidohydrolase family protein [Acidimicrobiales bacterium]|nr:amidohydrolase family protein [Acidimicrobiales bacterium]
MRDWSHIRRGDEDDEPRLPIKLGPVSNGEFHPIPHSPVVREAIRRTYRLADENARRLNMSRRRFLSSITGAAATLFVLAACSKEEAADRGERPGGTFDVSEDATRDTATALEELGGEEFIFDVQTHYVNYDADPGIGEWTAAFPQSACAEGEAGAGAKACFTAEAYFREVFVRSDTSMTILSALPTASLAGLQPDDMAFAIDVATRLGCDGRVLMHGGAYPHHGPVEAALASMTELRERYPLAAWKIYTMTPTDAHFYFDDHDPDRPQIGQRFIDHVREIGPPIICTHKGISSIVGSTPELADPRDIGPAAARNPDIAFVVYHSGFEPGGGGTGPYDPDDPDPQGVDRLIRSLQDAGVEPNSNVYAELGGTWWFLMRDPTAAAHVLGKLLRYVGEDRVVWGTDSIWFGTPQDQIQAMRAFQISEELQERHGYPALTDEVKAKIFGISSARLYGIEPVTGSCDLTPEEVEAVRASMPPARTYGPETYAEAAAMIAAHQAGYLV